MIEIDQGGGKRQADNAADTLKGVSLMLSFAQ
jgi:hypothetical protein